MKWNINENTRCKKNCDFSGYDIGKIYNMYEIMSCVNFCIQNPNHFALTSNKICFLKNIIPGHIPQSSVNLACGWISDREGSSKQV